ncbi:unnamed protein product [Cladocopium goreaui]|uniref:Uncharacterized protein n=1 Tax=Cladocopium goreaui TaxID=2562237 RepID=A0A9P1GMQ4_9DINO|nr:unnamed protein product [Cladocopium goreaui]|mmetsp:Transcript_3377/g.7907  ORF Transcript_3377/g.7907 Transcript_3377/m.7907 type:complete len:252 (+) Transcript_3377:66-821(+)
MPSMPGMSWKPLVAVAAGAAAVLVMLMLLVKEEEEEESGQKQDQKKVLHEILKELVDVEDCAKRAVDAMVKEQMDGKELAFDEAYERVAKLDLYDPLEKRRMGVQEFEAMAMSGQDDPFVMEQMARLSGGAALETGRVQHLDVPKIIELKGFAVDELAREVMEFMKKPGASQKDFKNVTIALKALVHAKVEKTHGVSAEDVEAACMMRQGELFTNQAFLEVIRKQQQTMQLLVSSTMSQMSQPADPGGDLD